MFVWPHIKPLFSNMQNDLQTNIPSTPKTRILDNNINIESLAEIIK